MLRLLVLPQKARVGPMREEQKYISARKIVEDMLVLEDKTLIEQEARKAILEKKQKKIRELESIVFGKVK